MLQLIVDNKVVSCGLIKFSDGATSVRVNDMYTLENAKERIVIVINDEPADAYYNILRQIDSILGPTISSGLQVELYLSYLPYARADRKFEEGMCDNPLYSFMHFLTELEIDLVTIVDPHNVEEIKASPISEVCDVDIIDRARCLKTTSQRNSELRYLLNSKNTVLCAPDKGARDDVERLDTDLDKIYCEKTRNPANGYITGLEILDGVEVSGRDVLIVDDLCDGGATFDIAAKALKEKGAKTVSLYVTHGIFSKGTISSLDNIFFYHKVKSWH